MNVVYLVRHGEAHSPLADPERGLTARGRASAERLANWIVGAFPPIPEIRHSGKLRAAQTAGILAEVLQPAIGPLSVSGLNPNDDVVPVAETLGAEDHAVMLVGHLPFLSRLASCLVLADPGKSIIEFDTTALARLCRDQYGWTIDTVVQPSRLG